jgi:hypothetical protein
MVPLEASMRVLLPRLSHAALAFPLLMSVLVGGCAARNIPNTDVRDTPENREVINFMEKYRRAVEAQDIRMLLRLASDRYLDDAGTPKGDDDLDRKRLEERLTALAEKVKEVRYDIRYRRVLFRGDRVLVDVTYAASFLLDTHEGERWMRRLADHRLIIRREGDEYRILSGM